jgi:hypothetical protein
VGDGRPKKRRETIMDNFEITTSPKAQNDNGVPRGRFPRRVVGGVAAALVIGVLSMSAAQARGFGGGGFGGGMGFGGGTGGGGRGSRGGTDPKEMAEQADRKELIIERRRRAADNDRAERQEERLAAQRLSAAAGRASGA